jgi:aminoglycoside 6'-N-acetyltransferase
MSPHRLRGERVTLRPLEAADVPHLAEIAAEPEVARWWLGLTEEDRSRRPVLTKTPSFDYRHASIDLFVATAWHAQGLGADTVRTLARWLSEARGHHRITIDPAVVNERAIRAYERAGFRRIGVMRRYERGADGDWRDGLLLDLLREDLP